jgi:hypothetical protein
MRRMSSVRIPQKNTKLSTPWDMMMMMTMIRKVLQEKQNYDDDIQPTLRQHFEAYPTDTNLSSQFEKQGFIVTAQNLDT